MGNERQPNDVGASSRGTIDVTLPARTDMAATLRVLVASLGADVGLTLDEIDDVRLAVNEVFSSVADVDSEAQFRISFEPAPGSLRVEMSSPGAPSFELDELATTILRSVIDVVETDGASIRLSKRAREATV